MEEYVQAAIKLGLRRITFLEHLEAGIDYFETTWLSDENFDKIILQHMNTSFRNFLLCLIVINICVACADTALDIFLVADEEEIL